VIFIRRAQATDEQALADIRQRAILTLAVPAMSIEQAEHWARAVASDRIVRAIQDHQVWVAVEQAAIGWAEVDRNRIAALYVLPSYAQRGIGSALLVIAETFIHSSGYTAVRLEASQNALSFYLHKGYHHAGPPKTDGAYPLHKDLATIESNQGRQTPC
jgi:GNAT superfamily N-acetyltransferase